LRGRWKLACAVRQTISAAKTKLAKERKAARRDGYDGLLFMTSFNATPTQVAELSKSVRGRPYKVVVWARGKLNLLLRMRIPAAPGRGFRG